MADEQNKHSFVSSIIRGDHWIWSIYVVLICISVVEIFSATAQLAYKSEYASDPAFSHIRHLVIGFVGLLLSQSMSFKAIKAWNIIIYLGGILLFVATLAFGESQKGAVRSIAGFQPVEACKIGVVMLLCSAIAAPDSFYHKFSLFRTDTKKRRFYFYLVIIALAAAPVATQNLSSGIIIGLACIGIMFMGRVNGKFLWVTILVTAVAALIGLGALKLRYDYRHSEGVEVTHNGGIVDKLIGRSDTWAERIWAKSDKPLWEEDLDDKKSQEIYAHMAIANGYPLGRFIGGSRLRDFLPEAFCDYIYAIIFEEWGFVPAALIPLLYLLLLVRCYILSRRTKSEYMRLLIIGLPLIICIQAFIHVGVCTGAMFVTGQPLPLISRGGSSLIATSISFGIMLALSRLIMQEQLDREALAEEHPIIQFTPKESVVLNSGGDTESDD